MPGSLLSDAVAGADQDTLKFLADVAVLVRYEDYTHLKLQVFQRVRAVALSDAFEEITDEARAALCAPMELSDIRQMADYEAMLGEYQRSAKGGAGFEMDGKEFLKRHGREFRRKMLEVLREGTQDQQRQIAMEMLERELPPKLSRDGKGGMRVVMFPENFSELLQAAVEQMPKRLEPGEVVEAEVVSSAPEAPKR